MFNDLRRLLLALLSQTPLVAGFVTWWPKVQDHPVGAALVSVLYEAGVLLIAFGKEIWAELKPDAIKATADWVRAAVRNFKPGFRRRYYKQVRIAHEVFNVRGLGLIDAHTLKLDKVFVDLKISSSSNPQRLNLDPLGVKTLADYRSIWDFMRVSKDSSGNNISLVIVGPPGCGKTTLLQHVSVSLATNSQRRFRFRAHIPVLLFLRDHVAKISENPSITLGGLAQQYFAKRYPKLKTPPDWFDRTLEKERCLVLLDGFDEVADAAKRKVVSEWVDQQIINYSKCRFVVTSRPQGYQSAPLERAHIVEVIPFSAEQATRFIKNWYLANEIVSAGHRVDDGVRQRAEEGADDLLHRLSKTPALQQLTANPLLLTMIAMVHRYRGRLPGSRVALYKEICEVLLERWRQAKGVQETLNADQKRGLLMPLAAQMMEHEMREVRTAEAMAAIRPRLERVGVTGEESELILSNLQESSGLLLEREAGRWGFAHLTFQEYLTAVYWLLEKQEPHNWNTLVSKSWWHETLRLYAAQGDATPILQACLDAGDIPSLTLASEIMYEGASEIAKEVRDAVIERLDAALESSDRDLRRLAAEVRLSHRLKSLHRIDDQSEIDLNYLTCAEYQLFIDEMRQQGRYYQPDHWTDYTFPTGQANTPVCGMRAEDAVAFCEWLTRRQGSNAHYRLPRPEEANLSSEEGTFIGTWCCDGNIFSLTKLDESIEQDIRQRLARISNTNSPASLSLSVAIDHAFDIALKRSRARKLGLAINFYLDLDRKLDLDRAHNLDDDLVSALSHHLDLSRELDLDRARHLAHHLDSDLSRVRDFMQDFERTQARAHDLDRNLSMGSAHGLAQNLALASKLADDLNLDLDHAYNSAYQRTLDLTDYGAIAKSHYPSIDPARARAIAREANLTRSQDLAGRNPDSEFFKALALLSNLLVDLLIILTTESAKTARQTRRKYLGDLLRFADVYNQEMAANNQLHLLRYRINRFWRRFRRADESKITGSEALLELHWWLQIVEAREAGLLPAWEGIRIVREQVQAQLIDS